MAKELIKMCFLAFLYLTNSSALCYQKKAEVSEQEVQHRLKNAFSSSYNMLLCFQ